MINERINVSAFWLKYVCVLTVIDNVFSMWQGYDDETIVGNSPSTLTSLIHWLRRQYHRRKAELDKARCQDRRRRPDRGTGRCCHSLALESKDEEFNKILTNFYSDNLTCDHWHVRAVDGSSSLENDWTSNCGQHECGSVSLSSTCTSKVWTLTLAEDSDRIVKRHGFNI